jgi:hypothetical protein
MRDPELIQDVALDAARSVPRYQNLQAKGATPERPAVNGEFWKAIYQVLLGEDQGPRFGSFAAIYGIANTRALIAKGLSGALICRTRGLHEGAWLNRHGARAPLRQRPGSPTRPYPEVAMLSPLILGLAGLAVLGTSFLSGVVGMAGGMILMGILLLLMDVTAAMVLHGVTQTAANGWRALLWRAHIDWRIIGGYMVGSFAMFAVMRLVAGVPDKAFVYIAMGITPFLFEVLPARWRPDVLATRRRGSVRCGGDDGPAAGGGRWQCARCLVPEREAGSQDCRGHQGGLADAGSRPARGVLRHLVRYG